MAIAQPSPSPLEPLEPAVSDGGVETKQLIPKAARVGPMDSAQLPLPPRFDYLTRATRRAWLYLGAGALLTFLTFAVPVARGASRLEYTVGALLATALGGGLCRLWDRGLRSAARRSPSAPQETRELPLGAAPWLPWPRRWFARLALTRFIVAPSLRLEDEHLVLGCRAGARRVVLAQIADVDADLEGIELRLNGGDRVRVPIVRLPIVHNPFGIFASVAHAQRAATIAVFSYNERVASAVLAHRDRRSPPYRAGRAG